ncbi:SpoIIE family protein phosphatase [Streptomyces mirabilis]|uniref:SpoIIE family protein phosphatase n=1 Tax=Streptomyces mirabilis TaxID=68239 RepID=UPI0036624778
MAEVNIPAAVADESGVLTGWSEGARRLLGYDGEEVLGRAACDLLAAGDPDEVWRFLAGRQSWNGKVELRHRDGHRVAGALVANRRVQARGVEWLLVWAVVHRVEDVDSLVGWGFEHMPGLLGIFDADLRVVAGNADMERALGLTNDQMRGLRGPECNPDPWGEEFERAMRQVLRSGERQYVDAFVRVPSEAREHAWSIVLAPLRDAAGRTRGVCFAARDTAREHEAQERLLLLNDAGARLGTSLNMTRVAQQLVDVTVPRFADHASVDLFVGVELGNEPPTLAKGGPVTLRRAALRSILEGAPEAGVAPGEVATYPAFSPGAECLATGSPVILAVTDAAIASWKAYDAARVERLRAAGVHSALLAPMRARGKTLGFAAFLRHRRPDPFEDEDLLLAQEITNHAAVCVDNARRYTREHATAETLQRSLLPRSLPDQSAIEIASRYLPAGSAAGVGGDWFDAVPLSGARVALVIGDVVGHGIQASVAMARLRIAMRTLADIDLPPEELLTHLDDVVIPLTTEGGGEGSDAQITGGIAATCLYAVYDPASRRCTFARAGHPPPVVKQPGGTADVLELPVGPPLGIGGLPFESAEVELPEGSLLALYTDGLVQARGGDPDEGLAALCRVLNGPVQSLEAACDAILADLLSEPPDDDIALLLVRTHALGADQVADWDVPCDAAVVAGMRRNASEKLNAWGLEDAAFVTELVVSELITNAIRYGEPPIQFRLIHDHPSLICEVSDASSTSPHLRRARVFDEGGRGLLLVAQFAQRWGTRHARRGKTIWASQDLTHL